LITKIILNITNNKLKFSDLSEKKDNENQLEIKKIILAKKIISFLIFKSWINFKKDKNKNKFIK